MSKNILIRDLSQEDQEHIEFLKYNTGHKTANKAVLHAIRFTETRIYEIIKLRDEIRELKQENELLKAFRENIEFQISLLDSSK